MKTAEEKVKKVGIYPEDFISSSGYLAVVNLVNDLDQKASYELKTAIDLLSKSDQQNKEKDEKIAELKRELDDVKVNHYNQLNDQLVQDIESLRKENEELKEDRRYWGREYTRLRELVTQYLDNSTSDNAYGADVRDRILNELNPKRAKQPKS